MAKTKSAANPAEAPDPHAGQGGRYEIDPSTGARRLVERTEPPAPPAPVQTSGTPPAAAPDAE